MNIIQHNQPARSQWVVYFVGWVVLLFIAGLMYHYWPKGTRGSVAGAGAETPAPPSLPTHSGTLGAKHELNGNGSTKQPADSIDLKSAAIATLTGASPQKWVEAQRSYLSRLDVVNLWDVLTAPGIADQTQSKQLRESLLLGCSQYLQAPESSGPTREDVSSPKQQCMKLLARGDKRFFGDQTLGLASDEALNSVESRAPGPDYANLSGDQYSKQEAIELSRLSQTDDPWLAASAMRALVWMQSPSLSDDWSELKSFNSYQRDQIQQTLATDVACRMTSYCGASSPWTIQYCSLVPGTQCPMGMSYDEIVQMNLSQAQLNLRQRILDNLSQRMAH